MSIKVSLPSCKEEIVTVAPPPCGLTSDGQSGSLTISQPVSRKRVDRRTGRQDEGSILALSQPLVKGCQKSMTFSSCLSTVNAWQGSLSLGGNSPPVSPELQERAQSCRKGPRAAGKGPNLQKRAQSYRKGPRAAGKGPELQERAQSCRKGPKVTGKGPELKEMATSSLWRVGERHVQWVCRNDSIVIHLKKRKHARDY